jgi:hypothetical protein
MRTLAARRFAASLVLLALLGVAAAPAAAQCSMCRSVLTQSPEGRRVSEQLNNAILVMLAAPYLVFGSFVLVLFRARVLRQVARVMRLFLLPR